MMNTRTNRQSMTGRRVSSGSSSSSARRRQSVNIRGIMNSGGIFSASAVSDLTPVGDVRHLKMVPLLTYEELMECYGKSQKDLKECKKELQIPRKKDKERKGAHGQNNLCRNDWSLLDHGNEKKSKQIADDMYRHHKYLPLGWATPNVSNKRSICARAMSRVTLPETGEEEHELQVERLTHYWNNFGKDVFNKHFIDMRGNDGGKLLNQLKSKTL